MKASASPLTLLDFAITSMEYKMISPQTDEDIQISFAAYDIDIDFGISIRDFIHVYITAKVNQQDPKPGYSLVAEAGCIFKFNDEIPVTDGQREEIEGYSTIYIALNSLRGLISSFTANGPFGRYILPSVDLNNLIAQKKLLLETQQQSSVDSSLESQPMKKRAAKKGDKVLPKDL